MTYFMANQCLKIHRLWWCYLSLAYCKLDLQVLQQSPIVVCFFLLLLFAIPNKPLSFANHTP